MLQTSNDSIEREKERDDTLTGLPAVRDAIAKMNIMLASAVDNNIIAVSNNSNCNDHVVKP